MNTPRKFLSLAAAVTTVGLVLAACTTANDADDSADSAQRPTSTVTSTSPQPSESSESASTTEAEDKPSETSRTTAARGQSSAQPEGPGMMGTPSLEDRQDIPDDYGDLSPTDVRVGTHAGFDRVVFEFEGTGKPGWFTRYTDSPAQPGSGFPVEFAGGTALSVAIEGTPAPIDPAKQAKWIDLDARFPGAGVVTEVKVAGAFEAQSVFVIGLDKPRPYSITRLENPTRVVVDIQK
ncbi:AMIN-like domain-containing (lipo)protein [Corynebacterium sp. MNWGS58]|uniref:AMIN-like domain-containing (lipo)protein n=1 Tax=Corynebacterium sp. 102791.4 TaxID=3104612 RepID=UPI003519321B